MASSHAYYLATLGWQSKTVVHAVEEKGEQHLREENMSLKEEAEKAKQNSEKRRLLTQTVQIPREILQELTSNGGVEGIKNMMAGKGWDKETPRAIMCWGSSGYMKVSINGNFCVTGSQICPTSLAGWTWSKWVTLGPSLAKR